MLGGRWIIVAFTIRIKAIAGTISKARPIITRGASGHVSTLRVGALLTRQIFQARNRCQKYLMGVK